MSHKQILDNLYHVAAELLLSRDPKQANHCAVCLVAIDYIESMCFDFV